MFIREFDESTDIDGLKACFIELQDFERNLVPSMPKGADICDVSIAETHKECKRFAGKILLAIENDTVAGYAVIHTRMVSDDVSDGDMEYGYISELAVLQAHRQKGYGKKLLASAEQVAKECGVTTLRIGVITANTVAAELYLAKGFQPLSMQLEKSL